MTILLNGGPEPTEKGIARTVWLFEKHVLQERLETDLADHHKVLSFDVFAQRYVINKPFDNGRADAIHFRDQANEMIKIWFIAFQTCTGERLKAEKLTK